MRSATVSAVLASSLLLTSASAYSAGESGFYIGASTGIADADVSSKAIDDAVRDLGFQDSNTDIDDTDFGWKIYGGYRFNRYLAVEAAYVNLGETEITTRTTGPAARVDGEADADGFSLQGIVRVPLTEVFGLFVKGGAYRWDVDGDYKVTQNGALVDRNSENATGTDLVYGAGVSVEWSNGVAFRAEWEHFDDVGDDSETGQADVNLYSFGLRYLF